MSADLKSRAWTLLNQTTGMVWNWEMVPQEWRDHYLREAQMEWNYKNWDMRDQPYIPLRAADT